MNEQVSGTERQECSSEACAFAAEPPQGAEGLFTEPEAGAMTTGAKRCVLAACGRNARFGYTVSGKRCRTVRQLHSLQELCVFDVSTVE